MTDEERRELARKRLAERQARLHGSAAPSNRGGRRTNSSGKSLSPQTQSRGAWVPRSSRSLQSSPSNQSRSSRVLGGVQSVFGRAGAFIQQLVESFGVKGVALVVAALVVLLLAIFGIVNCAGSATSQAAEPPAAEETQANEAASEEPATQKAKTQQVSINKETLQNILGDDLAAQMIEKADQNEDVAWIASHPEEYGVDGERVQFKLLRLATLEPEAISFVRGFPESYPSDTGGACDEVAEGTVPRLYQWDPRWGYTVYSSTTFALTGCCPTALSMVYQGLTGSNDLSPYDMSLRAQEGGYMTTYNGTDTAFLTNEAESLGLSCESISVDADSLRSALSGGAVVICNVGAGDFTDGGHFLVIAGLNDDGTLKINDPFSAERSDKAWDIDRVLNQTMGLWAYRLA